jgi:hypothetical protein
MAVQPAAVARLVLAHGLAWYSLHQQHVKALAFSLVKPPHLNLFIDANCTTEPPFTDPTPLRMLIVTHTLPLSLPLAATCAQIKGISNTLGSTSCGKDFDESSRDKNLHLRRLTMWYNDGCLAGLKTEYDGKGGYRSTMFGEAKGEQKSFGLGWKEYIKDVDVKGTK